MQTKVTLFDKPVEIQVTSAAESQLQNRSDDLLAEAELYFSCLLRKKMRFYENQDAGDSVAVCHGLRVRFRPIMTEVCGNDYEGDEPPVTDFPIKKPESYVPHWIRIDFDGSNFTGDFGYQ